MENYAGWSGNKVLGLRVVGSGHYVKDFLLNLEKHFADAEYDHQEEIRQEQEYETE